MDNSAKTNFINYDDMKAQINAAAAAGKWDEVALLGQKQARMEATDRQNDVEARIDDLCQKLGPILVEAASIRLTLKWGNAIKPKLDTLKLDILKEKLGIDQSDGLTYEELESRAGDMVIGQAREIAARQFDNSADDDFSERLKLKIEAVEKLLAQDKKAASRYEIVKEKVKNRSVKCLKRIA
jgi:hypothetical protein